MNQGRDRNLRTQHALQATDLAAMMNASFARMRLGPVGYRPELVAPEGPSTGGGKAALQRLRLVPEAPGYPTLVIGGANHAERTAELRTFDHVDAIHRHRFKRPVVLDRAQYDAFLETARNFMVMMQLRIEITGPSAFVPEATAEIGEEVRPGTRVGIWIGAAILGAVFLGLIGVIVWMFVLRR